MQRSIRKTAGISQIELAQKSGVSRFRISCAESGHLRLTADEERAIERAVAAVLELRLADIAHMLQPAQSPK
jgi:predicted transcriptional regulator